MTMEHSLQPHIHVNLQLLCQVIHVKVVECTCLGYVTGIVNRRSQHFYGCAILTANSFNLFNSCQYAIIV